MITWTLDINEANLILAVLGKLPYETVGELIPRLRAATAAGLQPPKDPPARPPSPFSLVKEPPAPS